MLILVFWTIIPLINFPKVKAKITKEKCAHVVYEIPNITKKLKLKINNLDSEEGLNDHNVNKNVTK